MKTCPETNKICYDNKGDAMRSVSRPKKTVRLVAYFCEYCNKYHLTSNSSKRGTYRKHQNFKRK